MNNLVSIDLAEAIESSIDRSKWRLMKFSDLVENIVEKVVPKGSGLKHYIGLDHLDTGTLHIKRTGETESLVGDKLKVYKGDLVFAKRNAYLKRVAIAEFDAVASAHSMVLRAKSKNVLPEFLPFFMLSESFWQRAIEISVGSLSPTINWKVLAKQEFLIPPRNQQELLTQLLWAGDEVVERELVVQKELQTLRNTFIHTYFKNKNYEYVKLGEVADIRYGLTLNSRRGQLPINAPYLRVANVSRGEISLNEVKEIGCTADELNNYQLLEKDLLVVEGHADKQEIGRAAIWNKKNQVMLHQNHLIRVRCNSEKVLPEVIEAYINSAFGQVYFHSNSKSTSGLNTINSTVVKECKVPLIDREIQNDFVQKKNILDNQIKAVEIQVLNSKALQKSLINQIF